MTRACYALTLLLVALGGSLLVTSPARCQMSTDYDRCGQSYHEICPLMDGYIETHEEVIQPAQTDQTTDEVDLRGRTVVAVLDDPVAIDANNSEVVSTDAQVDVTPADGTQSAPAAGSDVADIRSSSAHVESVNSTDEVTDVYNYGYRYEYMSKQGYYGQRYPEYHDANGGMDAAATQTESTTPQQVEEQEVASDDAGPCEKPYDAYDYVHHYDRAFDATCPSGTPGAAAEVAIDAVEDDPQPVETRDYENECYQAYLQRCAEDAVAQALVVEPAVQTVESEPYDAYGHEYRFGDRDAQSGESQTDATITENSPEQASAVIDEYAPYEPYDAENSDSACPPPAATEKAAEVVADESHASAQYDAYGYDYGYCEPYSHRSGENEARAVTPAQDPPAVNASAAKDESSYDVYDYDNGCEPAVSNEPPVTEKSLPCQPNSYGRHPYGYGYEYDYEYHKEYGSYEQADDATQSVAVDANSQPDVDVLQWVDLGREFLGSVVESDLVDMVRAEAEHVLAQVAQMVETMGFDQIRHDATQAFAAAVQQPLPAPSDGNEANVFLFMFDSDLNAEPVAAAESEETPWMAETQIVDEPPQDEQDTAIVEPAGDDTVSALVPIDRDQVIQWTRRAIASATAAWDRLTVVLGHFASHSLATVPSDDPSSTTQR
jgi:hypothetical protein